MAVDPLRPESLVDLSRYPLHELSGPRGAEVIDRAQTQMAQKGFAELDGFLGADAVQALVDDAARVTPLAYRSGGFGTAYLRPPDVSVPDGHPLSWVGPYSVGAVAYDLFPRSSLLRGIYEWEPMLRFVEAVLDQGPLFPYADSYGALNLAVMEEGDQLQWHFDQTDFVVSLAIRSSESGGDFEVAALIRQSGDEHFDDVAGVLSGKKERVEVLAMHPGTLLIFAGRNSLHRVTPVQGPVSRLVGLLAYDTKPGTVSSEHLRLTRYGRS